MVVDVVVTKPKDEQYHREFQVIVPDDMKLVIRIPADGGVPKVEPRRGDRTARCAARS